MVCIVCGDGDYPRFIARSCKARAIDFCLILLQGCCVDENWPNDVPKIILGMGQIGKALDFLRTHKVSQVVFAGHVKRPNFSQLSMDKTGATWLVKLGQAVLAGDDTLLRAVAGLVEKEGFSIVSGTNFLHDITIGEGVFSRVEPSADEKTEIAVGLRHVKSLGAQDIGQAAVVYNGEVIACEDVNGTDCLIQRAAELRGSKAGGILVKAAKPQQDFRLDLPTIGVNTIEKLHEYGFSGVAIESDRCIVLDKDAVVRKADEYGMFVIGVKSNPLKVFIIAGEASGDYLGANLMKDIQELSSGNVDFFGVGGDNMSQCGLRSLFSINELSIIGIFEVIGKILHVKKLINNTVDAIIKYQPDVVITIDSSGFTHRVAKKLKRLSFAKPIVHYVAPPVWAWRKWRAKNMHKFIDKLMVLLPFEVPLFTKHNLNTTFVGHPIAIDPDFQMPDMVRLRNFKASHKIEDGIVVTLLPGSRVSEIKKHMPVLKDFVKMMCEKYPNVHFLIPTIASVKELIVYLSDSWQKKPIVLVGKSQKVMSFYCSDIAVAASGTVTLELARAALPTVVIYRTSEVTYRIVKMLIQVPHVSLINILANQSVVPELLQHECTAENIFAHVDRILSTIDGMNQRQHFAEVIRMLSCAPQKAAIEVLQAVYN